ncbi:MAG: methenyltetrahydrofolate cyclohydrolase [Chloroflexota bacterium]|nr:methenyltetrahydrofolate cyclohydrolase [Chloroflexota bacterium]
MVPQPGSALGPGTPGADGPAYNRFVESRPQRFRDRTLAEFVDDLASDQPVPGGGSASAVAAALGAGLVTMVAALSAGRPRYAEHAAIHNLAGARARELADRFLTLADRDADAYAAFAAALKLPRDTDSEKLARTNALRAAARAATEVPLACVEGCRELATAAEMLAGRSNANAASDLSVASRLAEAGAEGAAANVLVNLPSVGDDAFAREMTSRVESLLAEIVAIASRTRAVVASGEARSPLPANA